MTCRHWIELEREYCKAKRLPCSCSGELTQCNYPLYYNLPPVALEIQRKIDRIQDTIALIEPFMEVAKCQK